MMRRISVLSAAVVATAAFAGSAFAATPPGLGHRLFYKGGAITLTVKRPTASYTSELGLYKAANVASRLTVLATNHEVGKKVSLTAKQLGLYGIKPNGELIFGIYVRNTRKTFFMGPGFRNPDGIYHAAVKKVGTTMQVGFEDLFGGGDRDYDDNNFDFSGRLVSGPGPVPPAPVNQPPDCSAARLSKVELWPPNHKFHNVRVLGCKDKENHPFTIQIMGVFQDEHVLAKGSGNHAPDAVIKGQTVDLRAERSGPRMGRVYHVKFRARDIKGAVSRVYTLYATVPKAPGKETPPKNGKATYSSTVTK